MSDTLFTLEEPYRADPPAKKVRVREHERAVVPRTRRADPATSVEAAASIPAGAVEARILEAFGQFGWLTDDELAAQLPDSHPPTVKSARSRLAKAGCLYDTGTTRPSNRGRSQIVWAEVAV